MTYLSLAGLYAGFNFACLGMLVTATLRQTFVLMCIIKVHVNTFSH